MKITLKQLSVFIAIAKNENMSHAAQQLHLSQSACSMALSTLEIQLSGMLFDRHGKQLTLNERGRLLLPKAENLIAQAKELQDELTEKGRATLAGHLLVGASTTIGNYLLPAIIGQFITTHPAAKISLQVANTEQVIQQLLNFDIDIGMIEGNCIADDIEVLPWREDELVVIAAPNNPLSKKSNLTFENLRDSKWILRESGSGTREKFEAAIGGKISAFLELGHTEAIKQAVQANLGISCLSQLTINEAVRAKQLKKLKTPFLNLQRHFYFLIHKEKYQTELLKQFIHTCRKQ